MQRKTKDQLAWHHGVDWAKRTSSAEVCWRQKTTVKVCSWSGQPSDPGRLNHNKQSDATWWTQEVYYAENGSAELVVLAQKAVHSLGWRKAATCHSDVLPCHTPYVFPSPQRSQCSGTWPSWLFHRPLSSQFHCNTNHVSKHLHIAFHSAKLLRTDNISSNCQTSTVSL